MSCEGDFIRLKHHLGHTIEVVLYGNQPGITAHRMSSVLNIWRMRKLPPSAALWQMPDSDLSSVM